ncbi:MAG: ArsR/SmtB family transcription factor [Burkholderiales bacterium]|jgi:DNA-binding transcriptional ArsR family regulator|nr:helix-turn-helix domain-containing protein [Nitrosomonadaceae bacterium]
MSKRVPVNSKKRTITAAASSTQEPAGSVTAASDPAREAHQTASLDPAALQAAIASLSARIERLESALASRQPAASNLEAEKYWVLHRLQQGEESRERKGEIVYAGVATLPTGEQYLWQRHGSVAALLKSEWSGFDAVIAALGHPVRLRLLKLILGGKSSKAELEAAAEVGTSGQLYHHLKILQDAGWVRSLERGQYGVPGERVVPLLAILLAAAG